MLSLFGALLVFMGQEPQVEEPSPRPHIVVILADDLGYGDVACYGATKIPTPHIDGLAEEGVRLTDAHSPSAICSPSRYGILTGRYAWRTSLKHGNVERFEPLLIETDRATLPGVLRDHGYDTAFVGKWHLGFGAEGTTDFAKPLSPGPLEVGFDRFFGSVGKPGRFFKHKAASPAQILSSWYIEGHEVQVGDLKTWKQVEVGPTLTARAVEEIESHSGPDPLFLFLSLTAVHKPLHPAPFARRKSQAGRYGDFVVEVDWSVGQVLGALDKAEMAENSLVIFTSDNGPEPKYVGEDYGHAAAGPWRGSKRDLWEGGHRVPLIARWPGRIPAGSSSDRPMVLTDLLATCAAAATLELPEKATRDSHNVLPMLLGREAPERPPFVLHSSLGEFALRSGDWKLILCRGSGGNPPTTPLKSQDTSPGQLYNLAEDPGETNNLWSQHPEIVKRLSLALETLRG